MTLIYFLVWGSDENLVVLGVFLTKEEATIERAKNYGPQLHDVHIVESLIMHDGLARVINDSTIDRADLL